MRNIEIKAPLPDRSAVEAKLERLGARNEWTQKQRDTFYAVPKAWLKLREHVDGEAELIAYHRSTATAEARPSDYERAPIDDAERWKRLFGKVLEIETVVEKERTLWIISHTRVHLDRVAGLGDFLELETVLDGVDEESGRAETETIIDSLGLERGSFLTMSYRDMLVANTQ